MGFFTSDRHKNELSVPEPARQDPKGGGRLPAL